MKNGSERINTNQRAHCPRKAITEVTRPREMRSALARDRSVLIRSDPPNPLLKPLTFLHVLRSLHVLPVQASKSICRDMRVPGRHDGPYRALLPRPTLSPSRVMYCVELLF